MTNHKVHRDKRVSLETAKLLGLAVTWGGCKVAYKFVRTPNGFDVYAKGLEEAARMDMPEWTLCDYDIIVSGYLVDVEALKDGAQVGDLLLVEFGDE